MDRSSFNFKGSTNDLEKRLEFKARLANKIEPPQRKELPVAENTFNGVSPGGKLVHPSLGEGILVEVDHGNNEVIIDFGSKGLIGLVLNQAKSFVHSPVKAEEKGIAGKDDAFIGGEILNRDQAPQNVVYRDVDLTRVTSPDFVVEPKKHLPAGTLVWHPDLGACRIASVNEATNSLSLDTPLNGRVDMVLSQVHAKLREIDAAADHVPVKPLVREPLGKKFPEYRSRGEVSVNLPEVFNAWRRNQQFVFLTRSQHLTTEQANDVFAVIDGKKPMFHTTTVSWQSLEETQASVSPRSESLSVKEDGKRSNLSILDQEAVWHPDLGECSISSVDKANNQLILLTSIGQIPCVLDVTVPTLAPIAPNSGIKRAPKALRTSRVLAAMEGPVRNRPKVSVSIPEAIVTWRAADQYQFLTSSIHLTPEQANDVVASMAGTLRTSKNEYEIQWTDEIPEAIKRAEVEQKLSVKEEAPVIQELPAPPAPVDTGVQRVVEEVVEVKKTQILKKLEVILPSDFNKWTASGQYVFLTRTKQLTSNEANDVLDVLHGKPINSKVQYDIVWSE